MSAELERSGGDQLEDEVGDPERRVEAVEIRARPNVVPMIASRIQPRIREARNAAVTMRPARARLRPLVPPGHAGRSPEARRRPRMGGAIRGPQPRRRDVRVDLGRRQAAVPEQLLDDPQVRPAVEEVGGEAVAQRVRRHPDGQAGPPPQALEAEAQAARAERGPEMVQEQLRRLGVDPRRLAAESARRSRRTGRPSARYSTSAARAGRAQEPDPLLATLAHDPQLAAAQVEVGGRWRSPARRSAARPRTRSRRSPGRAGRARHAGRRSRSGAGSVAATSSSTAPGAARPVRPRGRAAASRQARCRERAPWIARREALSGRVPVEGAQRGEALSHRAPGVALAQRREVRPQLEPFRASPVDARSSSQAR